MKNIWDYDTKPLTDLLEAIVDNRGKTVPTTETGRILIATNCVTNNTLFPVYEKVRFISDETYETWFRAHPIPGDIIFVNKGTPGKVCMVPDPIEFCIAQDMIALRANDKKIYNKYLFAVLRSERIQKQIYNTNVGDVIPHFKKQFLDQLLIPIPPREIQEFIGNLYYQLSYKIELNKQINDNLEQQAQAAFNNIVANYSECETINLSEIAALNPKRTIAKGTLARSIEMAQLPTSGSFPAGWDMKEYNGGMKFQNGDTLMARITPCLENGKVAYINFLEENEVAFGSTEYIVIAPKGAIAPEVFYFLTRHNDFIDFAVKNMNGSSGRQRVSAETIGTYKLPIISPEDIIVLETIAKEALNKIKYNSLENIRLSEMRDTLLPKLMSGEIKINEIDC